MSKRQMLRVTADQDGKIIDQKFMHPDPARQNRAYGTIHHVLDDNWQPCSCDQITIVNDIPGSFFIYLFKGYAE